jgi:hypothetical protein
VCQIFPPDRSLEILQTQRPRGVTKHRLRGEVLRTPRHQPGDGPMVEGGQEVYQPEHWLVWDD